MIAFGKRSTAEIGKLIRDDFDRSSLTPDWATQLTSATASISSNDLLLSGGGTAAATQYIYFDQIYSCLDYWRITMEYKTTTRNTTSFGYGVGVQGFNSASAASRKTFICTVNLTSTANEGKTAMYSQTGSATAVNTYLSSSSFAIAVNSDIRMEVIRERDVFICNLFNLTAGTSKTDTFTYTSSYNNLNNPPATGKFGIWLFGGSATVKSFEVSTVVKKNTHICFVGDSITAGFFAGANSSMWSDQVMLYSKKEWVRSAGGGDSTQSILDKISEIIRLSPKYVLLMIGGNDILFSVAAATYQANYMSIRNQLTAAGIKVIHCLATPRSSLNVTAINNYINSTFANIDPIVDTYTPLKGSGTSLAAAYDPGDGVHPNAAGHALIGTTIREQVPFIFN